ncbi:hypothetical protein [Bacteroides pyogenes]|uniref:hypothetical protein n=1 Tax=Bacteroides pyogenes TaxID=310300 RepID=UPI002FDA16C2
MKKRLANKIFKRYCTLPMCDVFKVYPIYFPYSIGQVERVIRRMVLDSDEREEMVKSIGW